MIKWDIGRRDSNSEICQTCEFLYTHKIVIGFATKSKACRNTNTHAHLPVCSKNQMKLIGCHLIYRLRNFALKRVHAFYSGYAWQTKQSEMQEIYRSLKQESGSRYWLLVLRFLFLFFFSAVVIAEISFDNSHYFMYV